MAIRLSGLVSNMDTDSIIKELMKAQSLKKTKVENKITSTEWKQEKWKALNAKIYALYTGSINKMRFQGSFATKSVTSSDTTKVSVTASTAAAAGSHKIEVSQLASAQYITSGKLADTVVGTTKLTEIDTNLLPNASGETKINFSTADKSFSLTVTANTTVNDFVAAAKSAGINASFDNVQKRIFLSSSESGAQNAFSMTTSTSLPDSNIKAIRDVVGYSNLSGAGQAAVDNAIEQYYTYKTATTDADKAKLQSAQNTINTYIQNKVTENLKAAYTNNAGREYSGVKNYETVVDETTIAFKDKLEVDYSEDLHGVELQKAIDKAVASEATKYATAVKNEFVAGTTPDGYVNEYETALTEVNSKLANVSITNNKVGANDLSQLKLFTLEVTGVDSTTGQAIYNTANIDLVTRASDSKIIYNGAELTGSTNTITANGLTFDIHTKTTTPITLTVANDTQGTYDTVKKFVKEYNELLKEMNSLYYAESSRGYNPLTDEEKESMSEGQIEKWETKIKDSLLRRDDKLGSLLSTMKTALMGSAEYNGKSYALSSFGIGTSLYTEKGLLHIDGDPDDISTAMNTDKLKAAIEKDPDAVMTTITTVMGNLYTAMSDKMKTSTLNSALTFYNDKELSSNLKTYKSDLKTLEARLKKVEDKYYKQFSAMESAMSRLNSQSSSLASLMGTN